MAALAGRRKSFIETIGIEPFRSKLDKVRVIFFQGNEFSNQRPYELDESCAMFGNSHFVVSKKTVLYIHGYADESKFESVSAIVEAYLQRDDHNVLVLDWSELASGNYLIDAVPNAKQLATKMSEVILDWVDEGLDVQRFHVIGHSLGAQVAALIARNVHRKSPDGETTLTRITALDPPPLFPLGARINEKDAEFVEIIHTEQRFHSTPKSPRTVNFWPQYNDTEINGRAWLLWAESVHSGDEVVFLAVHAKGTSEFKKGQFDDAGIVTMGIDCPLSAKRGDYFLLINDTAPYAKGLKGLKYERSRSNSVVGSLDIIFKPRSRSNSLAVPHSRRNSIALPDIPNMRANSLAVPNNLPQYRSLSIAVPNIRRKPLVST